MQPDLPWNVAGIPPEAREAAKTAARREGLSVGEWLTRRILRSLVEGNSNVESSRDTWRFTGLSNTRSAAEPPPASTSRDSEEMLARVSRTEADSQDSYRRVDEQLRGVARRLDQAERSQTENNRAMSKAAAEINVAAREQAQAFDQLGAHVVGLNDRLTRIERDGAADGVKDSVKALQQGLSRLAEQMSQSAHQSALQVATLANNIEQVAGRLIDARGEIDHVAHALGDRIASMDVRVRSAERDVQIQTNSLEKALNAVDASHEARRSLESELQRQASGLSQLNETLDRLNARFAAGETQHAATFARLEDNIAKFEAGGNDPVSERRLEGIEQALTGLVTRLEETESKNLGSVATVEESLRKLSVKVDDADKRHADAIAELRAATAALVVRSEPVAPAPQPSPSQSAPQQQPPASHFDLPPFPPEPVQTFQQPLFGETPAAPEPAHPSSNSTSFAGEPFGADPFAASASQDGGSASAESFLAAARRSAGTSASTSSTVSAPFASAWGAQREPEPESKVTIAHSTLIALLAILMVAVVLFGVIMGKNLDAPVPQAIKTQIPAANTTGTPPPAAVPSPAPSAAVAPPPVITPSAAQPATETPRPATTRTETAMPTQRHLKPPSPTTPHAEQPAVVTSAEPSKPAPAEQSASTSPLDRLNALANTGSAKAELLLGLRLLDGEGVSVNEAEAAKWLERAAKQNEPVAAYRLGTLYERGHGVPADSAKAAQWYEVAAKEGNRKAMHNLAVSYANGTGVQKDLVVAAQWFSRAANLGLPDSQFNLAVLYERGMGLQQSLTDAYKWYAIAAQQGDAESKARLDALGTQLNPDDKAAAQKAADSFHAEATDRSANVPPDQSMVLGG